MTTTGSLITNYTARRKSKEERLVCVDFDNGGYLMMIAGSVLVKVPRMLSFSQVTGNVQPFHTEFAVFLSREMNQKIDVVDMENISDASLPEMFCSKLTRLYGNNGKLSQA